MLYKGWPESLLTIIVKDTGVGIAPEEMPSLFTRFGKLLRTANINHEGLGLGLNIVSQIVDSHGGHIDVQSDGPGKGSTFRVRIKLDSNEPHPAIEANEDKNVEISDQSISDMQYSPEPKTIKTKSKKGRRRKPPRMQEDNDPSDIASAPKSQVELFLD